MNIGFIVNDPVTELPRYTSMVLGWAAACRGHDVYVMGAGDLMYLPDGSFGARAIKIPAGEFEFVEQFSALVTVPDAPRVTVTAAELDVLFNRHDPTIELDERSWAQTAPIVFCQIAVNNGLIVLPDPYTQWNNIDKMYLQHLPEKVRPRALITRDVEEIRQFWEANNHEIIIKPLLGSRGTDVFLLSEDGTNLNQMVEAVARKGYIVAQEYLPAAREGDIRLFMVNGKPLTKKNKVAAFRRVNGGELRSNMSAGGRPQKVAITDDIMAITEAVRPLFVRDGIFMAGLDIAGDKLMEINVSSCGGLYTAGKFIKSTFSDVVIEAIERKVEYKKMYGAVLSNRELACME
jgi:glutathione synthase